MFRQSIGNQRRGGREGSRVVDLNRKWVKREEGVG